MRCIVSLHVSNGSFASRFVACLNIHITVSPRSLLRDGGNAEWEICKYKGHLLPLLGWIRLVSLLLQARMASIPSPCEHRREDPSILVFLAGCVVLAMQRWSDILLESSTLLGSRKHHYELSWRLTSYLRGANAVFSIVSFVLKWKYPNRLGIMFFCITKWSWKYLRQKYYFDISGFMNLASAMCAELSLSLPKCSWQPSKFLPLPLYSVQQAVHHDWK